MSEHHFEPLHLNSAVTASCSCGWVSGYSHAYEKYAEPDWTFHVKCEGASDDPHLL